MPERSKIKNPQTNMTELSEIGNAAKIGDLDIVKSLFEGKADINDGGRGMMLTAAFDEDGEQLCRLKPTTPLFLAAKFGHTDVVCYLADNGAKSIKDVYPAPQFDGAFAWALDEHGDVKMVDALLRNKVFGGPVDLSRRLKLSPNTTTDMFQLLIDHGNNPTVDDIEFAKEMNRDDVVAVFTK